MAAQPPGAVEIFYSYAHEDEDLRDKLVNHLANLKRQKVITQWHDRKISAGAEWAGEIDQHLETAQIILLLISDAFMASDYCFDVEVKRAMGRHAHKEAVVIPVILRPVDWEGTPFSGLQCLPKDATPVTSWRDPDEAFLNVAQGIRRVVARLRGEKYEEDEAPDPSEGKRSGRRDRLKQRWVVLAGAALATVVVAGIILAAGYFGRGGVAEPVVTKEPAHYVDEHGWGDAFAYQGSERPDEAKWSAAPEWSIPKSDGDSSLTVHGEGVGLLKMPDATTSLYAFKVKFQVNVLDGQSYAAWVLRASPNKQDYYLFIFTFPTKDKPGARFEGFVYKGGVRLKEAESGTKDQSLLSDNSNASGQLAYTEFHKGDILYVTIEARENKFTHTFNLRPVNPTDKNFGALGLAGRPQNMTLTDPKRLYPYGQFGFRLLGKDDEMSVESVDIYQAG